MDGAACAPVCFGAIHIISASPGVRSHLRPEQLPEVPDMIRPFAGASLSKVPEETRQKWYGSPDVGTASGLRRPVPARYALY